MKGLIFGDLKSNLVQLVDTAFLNIFLAYLNALLKKVISEQF